MGGNASRVLSMTVEQVSQLTVEQVNETYATVLEVISTILLPGFWSTTATMAFPLSPFLGIFSDLDHAFIMALHTIYALACLGKNKFVDSILAYFAFEAMSMIRVVTSHDGFIENGEVTDVAVIGTVGADWGAI